MVVEKEIAGASNDASNAPSLHTIRASRRPRKPTQKLTDSQVLTTPDSPPKPRRTRHNQPTITVFEDPITPPPTQPVNQSTQPGRQKGQDPSTSQKRRRKATNKASKTNIQEKERWEQDFDQATSTQAKFEVLIEALGHEEFPDYLRIPQRDAVANLSEDLDPLNPLWLWEKFFLPEVLWTIATNTNENEKLQYESQDVHTRQERSWADLTGPDVGAFIGAAMVMGVQKQDRLEVYWNTLEDQPSFPIQQEISRQRFSQIARYLKVNSPTKEPIDQSQHDYHKLEPLLSSFRQACQQLITLPKTVSIDENLLAATTRTHDLIQIDNKAAGKGYKVYTLCCGHYLYDWIYTSKRAKVPQAKNYAPQAPGYKDDAFTDTERMVLTMVEQLLESQPEGFKFQIAFDNFFTTTRLFTELRAWGVGAFGTAKAGSGIPKPHLFLDKVSSKERNYGEIVNTVGKGINFITFIDQGAVWMMSTVHDVVNQTPGTRHISLRPTASTHLATEDGTQIPYHQISCDYNYEMNGSDVSQQVWNTYSVAKHCHRRNWWPLFWHLVAASIANVLFLYKLQGHNISHLELQQRLGLQLLRNPASISRKRKSEITPSFIRPSKLRRPTSEHRWTRLPSLRDCVVCCPKSWRRRGQGRKKRKALAELLGTDLQPSKRKRGKRTTYACEVCEVALCYNSWCWQRHHGEVEPAQIEGSDNVENTPDYDSSATE